MKAQPHPDQERRLAALRELDILDTDFEREYDNIVEILSHLCEAPIAVVNLIDADRQWFKAETGLGVRSTPLDTSLCSHVILEEDFVEIPDTLADPRMADNPLCCEEDGLRFYAGALLKTEEGLPVGTLCVLDRKPRELTEFQREMIRKLALQVTRLLDLRLALKRQEVLAREIDHRVKNTFASMSALVRMQSSRAKSEETRGALDQIAGRLASAAALHDQLHRSMLGGDVELAPFVDRLVGYLREISGEGAAIEARIAPASLPSEAASIVGLAINEFVANAFKHGGAPGSSPVTITGKTDGDHYVLTCSDGSKADARVLDAIAASGGLGIKIIETCARTLGGEHDWSLGDEGVVLTLRWTPAKAA
ncbi:histidine kinase dimerization/phosphoacceptor domain -containing protein [Qipengyuania nanhaisediminis]|uniref:histidine kinase dimerization/phosphoacceptor domain -containing protein n=1 Tax=Qipengyuania nanhaisediminis TaxID=604088 RepID=UPI0038B364FA